MSAGPRPVNGAPGVFFRGCIDNDTAREPRGALLRRPRAPRSPQDFSGNRAIRRRLRRAAPPGPRHRLLDMRPDGSWPARPSGTARPGAPAGPPRAENRDLSSRSPLGAREEDLDLDALRLQEGDRAIDLCGLPVQLERHQPDLLRDRGALDVRHDLEVAAERVEER